MTISSQQNSQVFLGDGVSNTFQFSFVGVSTSDLSIYITTPPPASEIINLTSSQYTIVLNPYLVGQLWQIGGVITYPLSGSPLAVGATLTITRTLPLTQQTSIANQSNDYPEVVEREFDTLTMQIQQIAGRTGQFRGVWTTATIYNFGDYVIDGVNGNDTGNYYMCIIANTSTVWNTDLTAGDWYLVIQFPLSPTVPLPLAIVNGGTGGTNGNILPVTATGATTARTLAAYFADTTNVRDFGAVGNGTTDDTAAIQAALDAAGVGGTIIIPKGTYLVSATLTGLPNQQIIGGGSQSTIITRTGDYGDTLKIGTISPALSAAAVLIQGIWFMQTPSYITGETSLPNLATTGAHIHIINGQWAIIQDCTMWRMPYGIHSEGGSLITMRNCQFNAVWDPVNAGVQEGIASIFIDGSNTGNYTQLITIDNCYTSGALSASRTITYNCNDGNVNITHAQPIGPKYGIEVNACEGLTITNSYFGGAAYYNIASFPIAGSTNLEWKIANNFFDSSGGPGVSDIGFLSQDATTYPRNVTITGNTFNGEDYNQNAIQLANGASLLDPALDTFAITGNSFSYYVGTPIAGWGVASGGLISDNIFYYYNQRNIGTTDPLYIYATSLFNCSNVICSGNQVNSPYAYGGIFFDSASVNCVQDNTMWGNVSIGGTAISGVSPDSGKTCILGVLKGANFNTTADQAIHIVLNTSQKYAVTDIWVTNASISLTTAAGGFYTAASKGGTAVVTNTQVYTACSSAAGLQRTTIATAGGNQTFTSNPLYLSLTTPQGSAATADIYIRGVLLT